MSTVRADFYPDLMGSPLWKKIQFHRMEVVPLDEAGLREAIIRPSEDVGVFVEAALLERLVTDAVGEPGVLPLVQETLVLLWERLERRFLPLRAYEALVLSHKTYKPSRSNKLTGLQVAIARRADAALAELSEAQRAISRRIFLRLVQFGEGRADTRRQQPVDALRATGDDSPLFDRTLRHLADSRLLTLSGDEGDFSRKVDIAHEALISGWPALQQWIAERQEAEQARRRLAAKAEEWVRFKKGKGGLLDNVELAEAERWLSTSDATDLGYDETLSALVEASRRAIQEAEQEKEERQQREIKLIRERLKQQRKATRAITITAVAILGATGFAWWEAQHFQQLSLDVWSHFASPGLDFLKTAEDKANESKNSREVDRALAYYRQIRADTVQSLGSLVNNSKDLQQLLTTDAQKLPQLQKLLKEKPDIVPLLEKSKKAEVSMAELIHDHLLNQLAEELKDKNFGNLIPHTPFSYLEKQYTEGALQTTYKILLKQGYGAGADLNNNGKLDNQQEADQIPCKTLKDIEELWRKKQCRWYGSNPYYPFDTACSGLQGRTLASLIFND